MKPLLVISLMTLFSLSTISQDIDSYISKYTRENGMGYLQPLADASGADFNSGLFHGAGIRKMGFQFYIGLVAPVALIPEKRKTFTALPEGFFEPKNPVDAPTVFGASENLVVNGEGGTQYLFPGGLNMKIFPLAMPQLTIGSIYGTDLTVYYITSSTDDAWAG